MLRALSVGTARRFLSTSTTSSPRPPLHQPLGSVPPSTDPAAVRGKWKSNAMEMIGEVKPVKVSGNVVACDGGGGRLGHPIEYIRLDNAEGEVGVCKYCGLRYVGDGNKGGH